MPNYKFCDSEDCLEVDSVNTAVHIWYESVYTASPFRFNTARLGRRILEI